MAHDEWVPRLAELGQPSYRAGQLCNWIWKRGVFDVESMTDFSKAFREKLGELLDFRIPEIVREERSKTDGTKKFLIQMADGVKVETALLKQGDRLTACLSTQAGCAIGCPFCVTGSSGFERNLSAGEIAGQFIVMEKHLGREINNIVLMGMGEPLLNGEAVFKAIRMLNDPKMRGLGIRHITLSTAGIVPGIQALAASGLGIRLAVSLHASEDELRDELVPCNTNYPLEELMQALRDYQQMTGDRITIEYALFKDKNDTLDHARKLVRLLHGLHVYVNLIPANENKGGFERSKPETVLRFQSVLKSAGFESEIRVERGGDIKASCGQLKAKDEGEDASAPVAERPQPPKQTRSNREDGGKNERRNTLETPKNARPRKDRKAPHKPGDKPRSGFSRRKDK